MANPPNVRLDLPNRPENVLLVREMLAGVAQSIDLDQTDLDDIRTAATEACNNVVLHAYEGGEGPLQVEVVIAPGSLAVLVRDRGRGIRWKDGAPPKTSSGIGIPVIRALTREVDFHDAADGGTEVRMRFETPGLYPPAAFMAIGVNAPIFALAEPPAGAFVSVAPAAVARNVLPRLICVLASQANFSTDRISDAEMVADALAAHAEGSINGSHLSMAVSVQPRELELRLGPILTGRGEVLLAESEVDGLGRVLEKLSNRHEVASAGPYEVLTLQLTDRR